MLLFFICELINVNNHIRLFISNSLAKFFYLFILHAAFYTNNTNNCNIPCVVRVVWEVAKAHHRANMVHRCFVWISRNVELLTELLTPDFVTSVRPLLEYNSVIWSPSLKRDIALLEHVQRRFTKRLPGLKDHTYDECLKRLNLERLELQLRIIWSDLLRCCKTIFRLVHVNREDFFTLRLSSTRDHPYKLLKHSNSCSIRSMYFSKRIVNVWNRLSPEIIDFSSLARFRRSLL